MTAAASAGLGMRSLAQKCLKASGALWYLVAATGQIIFMYFIVRFYYGSTLGGHFEDWNRRNLITGYVENDHTGNLAFAFHVLVAAVVTVSGLLQPIARLRKHAIGFHRWNGRFYLFMGALMAVSGLWMVFVRKSYLSSWGMAGSTCLAIVTLICVGQTLRYALARRIDIHQKWAMRTFLVMNGVWFQRVGYMAWIILNQAPIGMSKQMDGPFDIFLGFAIWLIPLGVLELYMRARDGQSTAAKFLMAMGLVPVTGVMAVGIFGTVAILWKGLL